eukprot:gnl/TRDRNA2_/TRDRNA2_182817_c0_seq1.p1 gnl/TRDRNA2_/TRDRNA2_182817_c0~~gnl/TRDRNA2_/TRDRNA2_182817_c0_seq1.p1  ORF type:complete len:235 (+),score=87.99 gnl/TRDRNA2_/TRDRNA2_182817_c0_seq1:89-793(+)
MARKAAVVIVCSLIALLVAVVIQSREHAVKNEAASGAVMQDEAALVQKEVNLLSRKDAQPKDPVKRAAWERKAKAYMGDLAAQTIKQQFAMPKGSPSAPGWENTQREVEIKALRQAAADAQMAAEKFDEVTEEMEVKRLMNEANQQAKMDKMLGLKSDSEIQHDLAKVKREIVSLKKKWARKKEKRAALKVEEEKNRKVQEVAEAKAEVERAAAIIAAEDKKAAETAAAEKSTE